MFLQYVSMADFICLSVDHMLMQIMMRKR